MAAAHKLTKTNIVPMFYQLGDDILKKWGKYNYTEDALVETATEMLDKCCFHKQLSAEDLIDYSLDPDPAISANQIDSPFGDLQQILYRHARFYIEALYWCDGSTAIHDHGFSGAFYVMSGSSISLEYQFNDAERVNHHFWFGNLSKPKVSKLSVGSIRPIYSGKRFIHSVFHLDNPTVSIVVRTYQDDDAMPQFEYRGNKIRLVEELKPEFAKKVQGLRFTLYANLNKFSDHFKRIYLDSPVDEQYWLLRAFYIDLNNIPSLSEYINHTDDEKTRIMMESINEEAIIHKTTQLRSQIQDTELRYFIALLLNLPTWSDMVSFIQNYHSSNAQQMIERSLTGLKTMGFKIPANTETPTQQCLINKIQHITLDNALFHLINKRLSSDYDAQ